MVLEDPSSTSMSLLVDATGAVANKSDKEDKASAEVSIGARLLELALI